MASRAEPRHLAVEVRLEVRPPWPFRLPTHGGVDGVLRHRGGVLERLLHRGEEPVVVRVAQPAPDRVLFGAWARTRATAEHGIARMRFALGVDEDLRAFHERFARDELIGASVRRRPWLRVRRRPEPWEALAWAICEQLIEFERAAAIERRIVRRLGRAYVPTHHDELSHPSDRNGGRGPGDGRHRRRVVGRGSGGVLRDVPTPAALAVVAPALLQSLDLGGARARTLVRAAREVARGRIDLHGADHERAWQRLRAIPGIGAWTVEMLALHGQGRHDQVPAGDVGLLKLVGRALGGGGGGDRLHGGCGGRGPRASPPASPRARARGLRAAGGPRLGGWGGCL
ncbi:MAG: DNA-3-methyladenine glycosylase family protein, partial [Solirubrobacterales bacterium]